VKKTDSKGRVLSQAKPSYVKDFNRALFNTFRVKPNLPVSGSYPVQKEGTASLYLAGNFAEVPRGKARKWYQDEKAPLEDAEKEEAQYRFSGLVMGLAKRGYATDEDDNLIHSWIHCDGDFSGAWDSYTISERISNICSYCMLTSYLDRVGEEEQQLLSNRLVKEIKVLFNNLEVYEQDLTSNHYLNNGRAFVWLGAFLGNKTIAKLGKKIILDKCEGLFDDGVLREGSIHYHLLLSKNLFEVVILLKHLESISEEELKLIKIDKILERALELTSRSSIVPNIGDLSPDCDISWVADIGHADPETKTFSIEAKVANSWLELFGLQKRVDQTRSLSVLASKEYAVARNSDFELFVHRNPKGYSFLPSHSHCDSGSYFLVKNSEVLVWDKGRMTYNDDKLIRSIENSSVLIDGIGPDFRERGFYPQDFKEMNKHKLVRFDVDEKNISLGLTYRNHMTVERIYSIGDEFQENIKVEGKGRCRIRLALYLDLKAQLESDSSFSIEEDVVYPSYHQKIEVKKYVFEKTVSLPFSFSYRIK
jgi:hypothetical protein